MLSSQILFDNFADLALKAPYQRAPTTLQIIHCIESSMLYFLGRKVNVKSLRKSRQQQRRSSSSSKTKSKKKKFSLQKHFKTGRKSRSKFQDADRWGKKPKSLRSQKSLSQYVKKKGQQGIKVKSYSPGIKLITSWLWVFSYTY